MKKRLFIGIPISKELKMKITNWVESTLSNLKVRIIPTRNLHVTLIPPWCEKDLNKVLQKMDKIKGKSDSFELYFEKISYGPKVKKPRLIWLEGKGNKSLTVLQKYLEFTLKKTGKRKLSPHITIARFKANELPKARPLKVETKINWKLKVKSINLYESVTSSTGQLYKVLKKINLN